MLAGVSLGLSYPHMLTLASPHHLRSEIQSLLLFLGKISTHAKCSVTLGRLWLNMWGWLDVGSVGSHHLLVSIIQNDHSVLGRESVRQQLLST